MVEIETRRARKTKSCPLKKKRPCGLNMYKETTCDRWYRQHPRFATQKYVVQVFGAFSCSPDIGMNCLACSYSLNNGGYNPTAAKVNSAMIMHIPQLKWRRETWRSKFWYKEREREIPSSALRAQFWGLARATGSACTATAMLGAYDWILLIPKAHKMRLRFPLECTFAEDGGVIASLHQVCF